MEGLKLRHEKLMLSSPAKRILKNKSPAWDPYTQTAKTAKPNSVERRSRNQRMGSLGSSKQSFDTEESKPRRKPTVPSFRAAPNKIMKTQESQHKRAQSGPFERLEVPLLHAERDIFEDIQFSVDETYQDQLLIENDTPQFPEKLRAKAEVGEANAREQSEQQQLTPESIAYMS